MNRPVLELADLNKGDVLPLDAVIREMHIPVWGESGDVSYYIRLTNVPVMALSGGCDE